MSNITFLIFAYNEEKRISYAINNFKKYGDVFVLDGGSTDKTKEIAEQLGAKFYLRPLSNKKYVETQENFNFIKSIIKTDWIYWGYVDNFAPKKLVEKMVEISLQNKIKMVVIYLHTYLWGNVIKIANKSRSNFLFHKEYIDFSDNQIHGMGKFLGGNEQKVTLPDNKNFALRHFSTYDIHKFIIAHLNYAEAEALGNFEKGKKFSFIGMFKDMAKFIYLYRSSLKNGVLGILVILNYLFFRVMIYTKLYELENNLSLENIEKKYSKSKEDLLKEFE